jgi:preprotein translocase subunit SecF
MNNIYFLILTAYQLSFKNIIVTNLLNFLMLLFAGKKIFFYFASVILIGVLNN